MSGNCSIQSFERQKECDLENIRMEKIVDTPILPIKQRFDYIDIAKGMCILFVVWGHITHGGLLFRLGSPFRMPFFFLVAGMLFSSAKYPHLKDFVKVRARRLFLPYAIYSVVTWAVWALYNYASGKNVGSYWSPLLQTILAQGSGAFFKHNSPLWFIPCLFAVELMYFWICKLKDWQNIIVCFLLAGIGMMCEFIWGNDYLFLLPWNFDAALLALPFYSIGNVFKNRVGIKRFYESVINNKWVSRIIIIAITALLLLSTKYFFAISMGDSYYSNHWVFYPRAILGCASLLIFAILVSDCKLSIAKPLNRYWKWSGINSFDIMASHVPIKGFLIALIIKLLDVRNESFTFIDNFIIFIIVMIIDSYLVLFINKYIKPLGDKLHI